MRKNNLLNRAIVLDTNDAENLREIVRYQSVARNLAKYTCQARDSEAVEHGTIAEYIGPHETFS